MVSSISYVAFYVLFSLFYFGNQYQYNINTNLTSLVFYIDQREATIAYYVRNMLTPFCCINLNSYPLLVEIPESFHFCPASTRPQIFLLFLLTPFYTTVF